MKSAPSTDTAAEIAQALLEAAGADQLPIVITVAPEWLRIAASALSERGRSIPENIVKGMLAGVRLDALEEARTILIERVDPLTKIEGRILSLKNAAPQGQKAMETPASRERPVVAAPKGGDVLVKRLRDAAAWVGRHDRHQGLFVDAADALERTDQRNEP